MADVNAPVPAVVGERVEAPVAEASTAPRAAANLGRVQPRSLEVLRLLSPGDPVSVRQLALATDAHTQRRGPQRQRYLRGASTYDPLAPLRRTLRSLAAARLIQRLRAGEHYLLDPSSGRYAGSSPALYVLTGPGAELLAELDPAWVSACGCLPRGPQDLKVSQLAHSLMRSELFVSLVLALRARPELALARWRTRDLRAAFFTDRDGQLVERPGRGAEAERWVVQADAAFTLRRADGKRANFVVEVDRATMPVETRFGDKLRSYERWFQLGLHERWNMHFVTVLVVTTSARRREHLRAAAQAIRSPATPDGLFRFAVEADYFGQPARLLEAGTWQTLREGLTLDLLR